MKVFAGEGLLAAVALVGILLVIAILRDGRESPMSRGQNRKAPTLGKSESVRLPDLSSRGSFATESYEELGIASELRASEEVFIDAFCTGPQSYDGEDESKNVLPNNYRYRAGPLKVARAPPEKIRGLDTLRATDCEQLLPNTHALVLYMPPQPNPTHVLAEFVRPLMTMASICLKGHPQHQNEEIYVLARMNGLKSSSWYSSVFSLLLEWIAGSYDRVWVESNGSWKFLNGSLVSISESAEKQCFAEHSFFRSFVNGPWSKYRVPGSLHMKNTTGTRWPFTVPLESNPENSTQTVLEGEANRENRQGDKEEPPKETLLSRYIPLRSTTLRVGASFVQALSQVDPSRSLPTRFSEAPQEWSSIEKLGETVRTRVERENRKVRVLIYDRTEEPSAHFPRAWTNANETVSALKQMPWAQYLVEIEHIRTMPREPAEQARLYTSDVVICPHGGHLGNLIFSSNTLVIEGVPSPRFSGQVWYYWTRIALGHVIHPVRLKRLGREGTEAHTVRPEDVIGPLSALLKIVTQ